MNNIKQIGNNIDERALLFESNNEIYRKITPNSQIYYKRIFSDGLIQRLVERSLLMPTTLESEDINGSFWIKQEKVKPLTYFFEWPTVVVHQAAISCLELQKELFNSGNCLLDSHPWNSIISNGPKWVDIGSICEMQPSTALASLRQFEATYLAFLEFVNLGMGNVARVAFAHAFTSVDIIHGGMWYRKFPDKPAFLGKRLAGHISAALNSLGGTLVKEFRRSFAPKNEKASQNTLNKEINRLYSLLIEYPVDIGFGNWTSYSQAGLDPIDKTELQNKKPSPSRFTNSKFKTVYSFLSHCKSSSETLLDLACNRGIFSLFGAMMGYKVTGIDIDEGALVDLHNEMKRCDIEMSIILNDIVAPIEPQGLLLNPLPKLESRIQSDCVLCLALIHHLYFGKYKMSMQAICDLLERYTKKWLILEYVPNNDKHITDNYDIIKRGHGYSKTILVDCASKYFTLENALESYPDGREILLFRKK